ncbi:hypothetical protein [Salinarimonas chemoclinalis]|uniref:hypothetical protein n=1 Tax=Salinarimonas chemoclinalis TaxID=3241599 RepID=UPI0035561F44
MQTNETRSPAVAEPGDPPAIVAAPETPDRSRLALLGALSAAAAGGGCSATIEGGAQAIGSHALSRARQRAAEDPRMRQPDTSGGDSGGGDGGGGGGGAH